MKSPNLATGLGGGDWSKFLTQRDEAWLRFTSSTTKFRGAVPNVGNISALLRITNVRRMRRNLHCVMEYEIGKGISGKIHGVIIGEEI